MNIASTCLKIKITDSSLCATTPKITKHSTVWSWLPTITCSKYKDLYQVRQKYVTIPSTCLKIKITDSSLSVTAPKITKHSTVWSWMPTIMYMFKVQRFVPSIEKIEKAMSSVWTDWAVFGSTKKIYSAKVCYI